MHIWQDITKEIEFKINKTKLYNYYFLTLYHGIKLIGLLRSDGYIYMLTEYRNNYKIKYDKEGNFKILEKVKKEG